MAISDAGRGLVRRLGVTAAAVFAFAAASQQRAEALSLASPGTAPAAKFATDGLTTEVQHGGHGGGGFRGGGGGGFRGGGGFHGGGFRGGGFMAVASAAAARRFMAAVSGAAAWRSTAAAFVAAARSIRGGGFRAARVFHGGGYRFGYRHAYHRPHFHRHRRTSIAASTSRRPITRYPAYYGYPRRLPRGLDLLWAAQDLHRPWCRAITAIHYGYRYW